MMLSIRKQHILSKMQCFYLGFPTTQYCSLKNLLFHFPNSFILFSQLLPQILQFLMKHCQLPITPILHILTCKLWTISNIKTDLSSDALSWALNHPIIKNAFHGLNCRAQTLPQGYSLSFPFVMYSYLSFFQVPPGNVRSVFLLKLFLSFFDNFPFPRFSILLVKSIHLTNYLHSTYYYFMHNIAFPAIISRGPKLQQGNTSAFLLHLRSLQNPTSPYTTMVPKFWTFFLA